MPGYFLHTLDGTDSTNVECRKMAESGAGEGLIVQALSQSSGRGRRGRSWNSPKGNLYFSMLILAGASASLMMLIGELMFSKTKG